MENELCEAFNRSTQLRVYNPTTFDLYIGVGGGVFSNQQIFAYTYIGELEGECEYIWDITHFDYLIVGDEFVLDPSKLSPRPVLTWMREENQSDIHANCVIRMEVNETSGETKFYVWTIRRIDIGEELVYTIVDYMYQ